MRRLVLVLLLNLCALPLPAAVSPLADHSSPYLAMHADDPVAWRVWDESLLAEAQQQNRLIFISSGYFACHWCHVMQRESFRNTTIAQHLNNSFIAVKIDRELWPELDRYLIDFVERTRGRAGWPLNVFITPQGHPLVGTTYLPAEAFRLFVQRLQLRWRQNSEGLSALAREAARQPLRQEEETTPEPQVLSRQMREALLSAWEAEADMLAGGIGQEAKFPDVPLLESLLPLVSHHPDLSGFIRLTLEQMAGQGLRDHLGGGFFRYTVDPGWQQPHFEKMLIDNAQLARLYLVAAEHWQEPAFRRVALDTLDFVLREMRHPEGGYISALSAVDGDGVEGGYYLWQLEELQQLLGKKDASAAQRLWGMSGTAPWDEGHLPLPQSDGAANADKRERLRRQLLQHRSDRTLPRDHKRLAAANGMLLSALSRVAAEEGRYREAGKGLRNYLHTLWDGERLWRMRDAAGRKLRPAGLADYASVALGLLDWAAVAGDPASRRLAKTLVATAWQYFHQSGGWKLAPLTSVQALVADGVSLSPVSLLLQVNRRLGRQAPLSHSQERAALLGAPSRLLQQPLAYASYLSPLQRLSASGG